MSELDEEEEDEEEEEEAEDEEGEAEREDFCSVASSISTSESLELLSLSRSELLLELYSVSLAFFSQVWKISSNDGAFCKSDLTGFFPNSFVNASLASEKPLLERNDAIAAVS